MDMSSARATVVGIVPMTQSRKHSYPKLVGESDDAFDTRTWRGKLNCDFGQRITLANEPIDARLVAMDGSEVEDASIVMPAHGFHQCMASAAKYSQRKIVGQRNATWTGKFTAGIMVMANPRLNLHPNAVDSIEIFAHANGQRGSGKRVPRRLPIIPRGWRATIEVMILDPIITQQMFVEMLELAGLYVGMGQFRPQNGGVNGRFQLESLDWQDNRSFVLAKTA